MKRLVLWLAVTLIPGTLAHGNLMTNGSFESPDIPDGTWSVWSSVPGWDIAVTFPGENEHPPELEVWDPPVVGGVKAYDGTQCVELDSYDPTTISQIVTTVAGWHYELKYAWKPRPGVNCEMKVLIDGAQAASHSDNTGDWTLETYPYTATGGSTTVAFAEVGYDDQLGMLLDAVSFALVQIIVEIDIKPGSYPNSFNLNGNGVIPVAILGSASFFVDQIKVTTLEFAGLAVRIKGNGDPQCSIKDVNGDGRDDLVCQFVDDPDSWTAGETEATLTGELMDGTPFAGSDTINIVP